MDIIIVYEDLPCKVKGFSTDNGDGTFTIVLNSHLNYEQQQNTLKHELKHIHQNDFWKEVSADQVESEVRL